MAHKSQTVLQGELDEAKTRIVVGGVYVHFKSPTMQYRVIDVAIDVDDSSVCVIYKALYGEGVLFVRSLAEWIGEVDVDGVRVKRFTLF